MKRHFVVLSLFAPLFATIALADTEQDKTAVRAGKNAENLKR
jgi:hypothetical protein